MPPVSNFRGLRREIAVALRDNRQRTLYEISKKLGRRPGDLQRTVRQMHADGILRADDAEPGRGTHFWFNEDDFATELESALDDDGPAGLLQAEQRVVAVSAPADVDPFQFLARGDLNGAISWVAEWGGDGELLIGMSRGTPLRVVNQLTTVLRNAAIKCTQRRVGELMSADDLRRLTTARGEVEEVGVK